MSILRTIYLFLAVIGGVLSFFGMTPWVPGADVSSFSPSQLARAFFLGSDIPWDMLIVALTLTVFIVAEVYIRKDFWVLICIPITWFAGLSCGLPLYLFLRSRPVT